MNATPDLLVFNGKITTMDGALPETTAFAARTTTFAIMQSLRLDRGPSGPVHP